MADEREPPPLFGDEEEIDLNNDDDNDNQDQENEDLFASVSDTPQTKEEDDDNEDIFAEAEDEVPLSSPEKEETRAQVMEPEPPMMDINVPPPSSPATMKTETRPAAGQGATSKVASSRSEEEITEEEGGDKFNIEITVTEPKKIGDGMGAYMAYKVNTKSSMPEYRKADSTVLRRFSDFLGLHEKLVEKHLAHGLIVPPPPEKSVVGMTKIKMSKEDSSSADFVEKRRAALSRFLTRTAKHPELRTDASLIEFLTLDGDLPKSTSTSALSGAGVLRLFSKVGDSFGKITFKMDETDQWFEEKQQQIESMEHQLRKLHSSIEALVHHRKELAQNTGAFAKSAAVLGNAEEHTALSRALSQLAEVEDKVDQLHMDQADSDFFVLAELVKDYVNLLGAIKEIFHERVKLFKQWKDAEVNLNKKRETRAKLEVQRKMDKIPSLSAEITQLEDKVERGQEDFDKISKTIRKEMVRFEKQRVKDFKTTIINYLESLMNSQQQLIGYWESFLPEAKAIA